MVLRHYQRGGLIAKLLHDQYFGISLNQTRAWKEWNLLQVLTQLQLPVPQPVAARVEKHGLFYRADLVTVLLPDAETLAAKLEKQNVTEQLWRQIGVTIAQFHDHDVYHSDLNAKNIMLDTQGQVYLIDFDQCGFRRNGNWKAKNLERLKRSLRKFKNKNASFNFVESDWDQLMQGYKQGRSEA
jgi:tRNA A-37 threonylcarbamoyl transferase component Bud32